MFTNKPNDDDLVNEIDSLQLMLFFGSHVCSDKYEGKNDLTREGNKLNDNGTVLCCLEWTPLVFGYLILGH